MACSHRGITPGRLQAYLLGRDVSIAHLRLRNTQEHISHFAVECTLISECDLQELV